MVIRYGVPLSRYMPKPLKIVWVPKSGKTYPRPIGIKIPAIKDRALQTLVNLVLLPLLELTSVRGLRPYIDCKMAISASRMQMR